MSLKAFHILFITIAILMVLGCGAGALRSYFESGETGSLAGAVLAFFGAVALMAYEVWFVRKAKRISL